MIAIRKANERGRTRIDWLESWHSFSFGDYHDPAHMGFRTLRVINDDIVAPGKGFGMHPHRDMEIVTYIIEGTLEHRDSMGTGSVIRPGDVQRMSAGTGVTHSEFNPSSSEPTHLLQIWILPERRGLEPEYEEQTFTPEERRGKLRLVASRDGREGSVTVHQDVEIHAGLLEKGDRAKYMLRSGRQAWVQIARGAITLNGQAMSDGDGAAASAIDSLVLAAEGPAEVLLFDLA